MKQEQRVWLAAILSAFVLVFYAQILSRSTPPPANPKASPVIPAAPQASIPELRADEGIVTLENEAILLEVGRSSAAIRSVVLKNYKDLATKAPLKLERRYGVLSAGFSDETSPWQIQSASDHKAVWLSAGPAGASRELSIELVEGLPKLILTLTAGNPSSTQVEIPIKAVAVWGRSDEMAGRYNMLEAVIASKKTSTWQRSHLRYFSGSRAPRLVPRGTSMLALSERFFCQVIKPDQAFSATTTILPSDRATLISEVHSSFSAKPKSQGSYSLEAYIGPRDFFSLRKAGFEQAFPLGFLSKIGLMLMLLLKGLAGVFHNYGVAIVLLAAGITSALSPFTMISFRSMRKMQELQPRMDAIRKKYGDNAQKANQEVFALFKEHKVSPLSGCLPMMLQLPVFFALWSAITHVTELRGEKFLWIHDLSLPDRLLRMRGFDVNLLPLLMAAAMFIQSKLSQPKTVSSSTNPNPFSGPMMSIMFGVMFYQVPAGLVLYWLINSLTSIAWYRAATN